jgi:hypothetical protein
VDRVRIECDEVKMKIRWIVGLTLLLVSFGVSLVPF